MTANGERVILGALVAVVGGLTLAGAFGKSDPFPGADAVSEEAQQEVQSLEAPPAPLLQAKISSTGLVEDRGEWRGQAEVADFDGDGNLDIAASIRRWSSSEPADGMYVWLGDGKGGFTKSVKGIRRDMGYGGSDSGDANGDGLLDLAFSGHDTPPQVFLNNGDGTWREASSGLVSEGVCADVALGDFDGDQVTDLAVMGMFPGVGGLYFFQGDGEGEWELREELLDSDVYGSAVTAVDLEGDGQLELLAATSTGPRVWSHDETGFVDRSQGLAVHWSGEDEVPNSDGIDPKNYVAGSDLDLLAYDFDGDGVKELLATGMIYAGHDPLRVFRLGDDGVWHRWGTGLPEDEAIFDACFAELDGEGPPEIVLAGRFGMKVVRITGPGTFELVGRVAGTEELIMNCGAGDFDGDGIDEVLFIGFGGIRTLSIQSLRGGQS